MRNNSLILLAILLGLVAIQTSATSVIGTYNPSNNDRPVCAIAGTITSSTSTTTYAPDYVTSYWDHPNKESTPLFVKAGGDGTNKFVFKSFDKLLENPIEKACAGTQTAGTTFVALFSQMLIVKQGTTLKGCRFSKGASGDLPLVTFTPPATITVPITKFEPYYKLLISGGTATNIYFWLEYGTKSGIYYYTWPDAPANGDAVTTNGINGPQLSNTNLNGVYGTGNGFLDTSVNPPVFKNSNEGWVTVNVAALPSNPIIKTALMRSGELYIAAFNSNGIGGKLYVMNTGGAVSTIGFVPSTTKAEKFFTDHCTALMIISETEVMFNSLKPDLSGSLRANFDLTELGVTSDDIDMISDASVVMDKAVIVAKNKIQYLKIYNTNNMKKIYEQTLTGSDYPSSTSDYELAVKFSCFCRQVKRFACFSSTLNCIIVKKGSDTCGSPDTPSTANLV